MSSKINEKVNITPVDLKARNFEGGFVLTFVAQKQNGGYKTVNIKMERWWLTYVADALKEILREEQKEVDRLKHLCGFEPKERNDE